MATRKPVPAGKRDGYGDGGAAAAAAFFDMAGRIVERFGWPGILLFFGMYFIEMHATDAQESAIIEMYVLGHGFSNHWPVAVVSVVSIVALLAQKRHYDSRFAAVNKRLDEAAGEKSRLQEELIGKQLNHGPTA